MNVNPKSCVTLLRGILSKSTYFLYAVDYDEGRGWTGKQRGCIGKERFTILGAENCKGRGFEEAYFFPVDTKGETSWTAHLAQSEQTE
jgi:uncharacterized membrane protein